MSDQRPNIVFILTDQQRGDCLGVDPYAPNCLMTPNLDHLANAGAFFGRAYAECPTCIPARRTIFSGLAPAANGLVGMTNYDFDVPAKLPMLLRDAGYQTQLVGKSHLFPSLARHGFDAALFADATRGDWGCRYTEFLMRHGHTVPRPGVAHGVHSNSWIGRPSHLPEHLSHTYWCMSEAMDFIDHRDPQCPFFLNVGLIDPHPPFTPPQFYYDRYINSDLPDRVIGDWARGDKPDRNDLRVEAGFVDLKENERRCQVAAYLGMVNHIDDQVGRLMQFLKDRKVLNNTLIVFSSDHGEMLGDHYREMKARPFEGSARVPMIVCPPASWQIDPVRTNTPVGLQDIMPTLLDAAGVDVPDVCTGHSLMPLVRGEGELSRTAIHGEHSDQYNSGEGMQYLVDSRFKYIWYTLSGRELLFDLDEDPRELKDLSADSSHQPQLQQMRSQLVEILTDRPEGFVADGQLVAGQVAEKIMSTHEPGTVLPFV